jgi:hypothetical protein
VTRANPWVGRHPFLAPLVMLAAVAVTSLATLVLTLGSLS